jgi:hypothetical protein
VGCCAAGRWWISGYRGCVLVATAYVPASIRMRTRARRSKATERRVGGARLRAGLTGRNRRVRSVDRKSRARQILSRRTAVRGQNATANAPVKVRGSQHTRLSTAGITASENAGDSYPGAWDLCEIFSVGGARRAKWFPGERPPDGDSK